MTTTGMNTKGRAINDSERVFINSRAISCTRAHVRVYTRVDNRSVVKAIWGQESGGGNRLGARGGTVWQVAGCRDGLWGSIYIIV